MTRDVERVLRIKISKLNRTDIMHDCALERKRERDLSSAPRVEHSGHCSEISTKTKLQNHIEINIVPIFLNAALTTQGVVKKVSEGNTF